jgi:hypothetical protein
MISACDEGGLGIGVVVLAGWGAPRRCAVVYKIRRKIRQGPFKAGLGRAELSLAEFCLLT